MAEPPKSAVLVAGVDFLAPDESDANFESGIDFAGLCHNRVESIQWERRGDEIVFVICDVRTGTVIKSQATPAGSAPQFSEVEATVGNGGAASAMMTAQFVEMLRHLKRLAPRTSAGVAGGVPPFRARASTQS